MATADVAQEADAPRTMMTRFHRAYLSALYRMPPGAFDYEVRRAAVLETTRGAEDEG
jgi:hypothetical protein